MSAHKILAVVGLPGSGKGEVSNYLIEKTGWPHIHFGKTVTDEVVRRGQELTQANERVVREEFRAQHGMAAMAILNLPKIREHFANGNVVLESFYSWEEYVTLKQEFGDQFQVLAVMASFAVRAQRMQNRPERPLNAEELNSRDYVQIDTLHQAGPIARADYVIVNESTREDLHIAIDDVLNRLS